MKVNDARFEINENPWHPTETKFQILEVEIDGEVRQYIFGGVGFWQFQTMTEDLGEGRFALRCRWVDVPYESSEWKAILEVWKALPVNQPTASIELRGEE